MTKIRLNTQVQGVAPAGSTIDADLYKYQIVTSVNSGNLTVALKNYLGQDPSAAVPVKVQIGDTIRTITSACTITIASNDFYHFNAGSSELATKEIDYFIYLGPFGGPLVSRMPYITTIADGFGGSEKGLANTGGFGPTVKIVNIGRFNAIKASGTTGAWSLPATSVIINYPIFETRWLDCNSTLSAGGSMTISNVVINHFKYKIVGDNLFFKNNIKMDFGGTTNNNFFETLPFGRKLIQEYDIAGVGFGYDNGDIAPSVIFENTETNKLRIIKLTSAYAVVNNANIRIQGNYQI